MDKDTTLKYTIFLFSFLLIIPLALADVSIVSVPVTIKLQNYTFTIVNNENNAQYPYTTSNNTDASYPLNLQVYRNFTSSCPDVDSIRSICDHTLGNISGSVSSMNSVVSSISTYISGKKDYFDEYTKCVKENSDNSAAKITCEAKYADYDSLKKQREECVVTTLPSIQQQLIQKSTELNEMHLSSYESYCIKYPSSNLCLSIDGLKNSKYIALGAGILFGLLAYWVYEKRKRGKSQLGDTMTPTIAESQ